ncbi:MAG: TPD domain-containing protein [Candidatus Helarchaeota archaeon]
MLAGIIFVRYCQNIQRQTMFNFQKLRRVPKEKLKADVLGVAVSIGIAPVMTIRYLLKIEGFSKRDIGAIVREEIPPPSYLKKPLKIALKNDPVFSPRGIKYSKQRGKIGEDLIAEWLNSLSIGYDRDIGQGGPDHLLMSPLRIDISGTIKEFDWIESKASYGDAFELRHNRKQFDRYKFFGNGLIFYWFGAVPIKDYEIFTWKSLVNRVNPALKNKIINFISFVPPEFKHLIR